MVNTRVVYTDRSNFNAFSQNGIEFKNSWCVTPMCGPARRSMLTGLYPHTHGQIHNENDPPYNHEVYLDTLAENGFRNYYFGKWHAGPGSAYDHHCEGLSESGYGNPYLTEQYREHLESETIYLKRNIALIMLLQQTNMNCKIIFLGLKEGNTYQCHTFWCGEHAAGVTTTSFLYVSILSG